MDNRKLLGLAGSLILFVGVFAPIVSAPFVGDINYFQNGRGDGVIVLALAALSFTAVLMERYKWLWFTGIGSLGVLVFTFVYFQVRFSQARTEMQAELADNPFAGLADVAVQSVQLQWGWAILVVGAVLLITAAALKDSPKPEVDAS